jgi:hypothetical protein
MLISLDVVWGAQERARWMAALERAILEVNGEPDAASVPVSGTNFGGKAGERAGEWEEADDGAHGMPLPWARAPRQDELSRENVRVLRLESESHLVG